MRFGMELGLSALRTEKYPKLGYLDNSWLGNQKHSHSSYNYLPHGTCRVSGGSGQVWKKPYGTRSHGNQYVAMTTKKVDTRFHNMHIPYDNTGVSQDIPVLWQWCHSIDNSLGEGQAPRRRDRPVALRDHSLLRAWGGGSANWPRQYPKNNHPPTAIP